MIAESSVIVLPSHMEASGIVFGEAMSMKRPVIISRTGPGPEVVRDSVTGLLCDPYSPDDIADKVLKILSNEPLGARLGENARRDVLERFDIPVVVNELIEFYEGLIGAAERNGNQTRFPS
jgi:glycosyltransferase involved in cell wall biosynthesis